MSYIDLPITSDAYSLAQQAKGVLTTNGWTPSDGDPEVVVIESLAPSAQNAAEVAAQVPSSIFRKFGTDLVGLPYLNGAPAEGTVTFTIADSAGITVPANTFVQIGDLFFATIEEAVVPAGSSSVSGVSVRAIEDGTAGNALTGPVQLVDSLARVNAVTLVGTTTGGADAEDDDAYMSRLRATLQLMAPRPITADDYAVLAKSTPDVGVGRSTAIDGYNPANSTSNNPRMVYVVTTDVDGLALSSGDKAAIEDFLEPHREVNFVVNVADATYNRIGIAYSYKAYPASTRRA